MRALTIGRCALSAGFRSSAADIVAASQKVERGWVSDTPRTAALLRHPRQTKRDVHSGWSSGHDDWDLGCVCRVVWHA